METFKRQLQRPCTCAEPDAAARIQKVNKEWEERTWGLVKQSAALEVQLQKLQHDHSFTQGQVVLLQKQLTSKETEAEETRVGSQCA